MLGGLTSFAEYESADCLVIGSDLPCELNAFSIISC